MMSNKRAWKYLHKRYAAPEEDTSLITAWGICLALTTILRRGQITKETYGKMLSELKTKKPRRRLGWKRELVIGDYWWTLSDRGRRARAKVCLALSKGDNP